MASTSRIVRTRTGSYLDGELPKLQERHAAKLLELRKTYADRYAEHERLLLALKEDSAAVGREERRLVSLTTEIEQLLHADLAGIIPRRASMEPEASTPA